MVAGSDPLTNPDHAALHTNAGRGVLGYAQITASTLGVSSETDVAGLSVTVTVAASRRVKLTASALLDGDVAADTLKLAIKEGATQLKSAEVVPVSGSLGRMTAHAEIVITPSAAAHTYKVTIQRADGTGLCTLIAAATDPAFLLAEDIGAS